MAELTDEDIVAIAVGMRWFHLSVRRSHPRELLKLYNDKSIRELGRKIVLAKIVRLIKGEDIGDKMRRLIVIWCAQQYKGSKRGRPDNKTKEDAINLAYRMIEPQIKKLNPRPQRKAIIAYLAEQFGVKPRRVYEALKRQAPKRPLNGQDDPLTLLKGIEASWERLGYSENAKKVRELSDRMLRSRI